MSPRPHPSRRGAPDVVKERQSSFAAGVLDPGLWGRTDWAKHHAGAKQLENIIVKPTGALALRPGFRWVTGLLERLGGAAIWGAVRLVPMVIDDDNVFLVVFTHQYIRILKWDTAGRTHALKDWVQPTTVSFAYPYGEDFRLPGLRFAQLGPTLRITHEYLQPMELTRAADGTWSFAAMSFSVPAFDTTLGTPRLWGDTAATTQEDDAHKLREWEWAVTRVIQDEHGNVWETLPFVVAERVNCRGVGGLNDWSAGTTYAADAYVTYYGEVYKSASAGNVGNTPTAGTPWIWQALPDEPHYAVSEVYKRLCVLPDRPVELRWSETPTAAYTVIAHRVYRGRQGRRGFVGETNGSRFIDDGSVPDYKRQPPQGTNPFKVYDGEGTLLRNEWPGCVGHLDGRLVMGPRSYRPQTLNLSAVEDYTNFDSVVPPKDSDAIEFTISSKRLEHIRAFVALQQALVVLTSAGEWLVTGADGGMLTPTSLAARQVSHHGAAALDPVLVGERLLFVQNRSQVVRELSVSSTAVQSRAISVHANHLFAGHQIVDWAFQASPWPILWVVRRDGEGRQTLVSATYVPEEDVVAWTTHVIGAEATGNEHGAHVEAVAVVPENGEDALYASLYWDQGAEPVHGLVRLASYEAGEVFERTSNCHVDLASSMVSDSWGGGAGGGEGATGTAVVLTCTGDLGTVIPAGSVARQASEGYEDFATIRPAVINTQAPAWAPGTDYIVGDIVQNGGWIFGCIVQHTSTDNGGPSFEAGGWEEGGVEFRWYTIGAGLGYVNVLALSIGGDPSNFGWVSAAPWTVTGIQTPVAGWLGVDNPTAGYLPPEQPLGSGVGGATPDAVPMTITGMYHLEGQSVIVYTDVDWQGTAAVVTAGAVAAPHACRIAHVGLPRVAKMLSLDSVPERGRPKTVTAVGVEYTSDAEGYASYAGEPPGLLVGPDDGTLSPIQGPMQTAPVDSQWAMRGQVCLESTTPYPVTINAITREVEYGGK